MMDESERPNEPRHYILYDERACGNGDTDDASVVCAGIRSLKEAKKDARMMGFTCACFSYREDGNTLVDERWECDFYA